MINDKSGLLSEHEGETPLEKINQTAFSKKVLSNDDTEDDEDIFDEEEAEDDKDADDEPDANDSEDEEGEKDLEDEPEEDEELGDESAELENADTAENIETTMALELSNLICEEYAYEFDNEAKALIAEKGLEGFLELQRQIIEAESVPKYASETSKEFDEFIRNGGEPSTFFNTVSSTDYEKFEPKTDIEKIQILRDYDRTFTKNSVSKTERHIDRLVKAEDLTDFEEEVEEALKALQEHSGEQKKQLLAETKQRNQEIVEERSRLIAADIEDINNTSAILGVKLTPKLKQELVDFKHSTDKKGQTPFSKFLEANPEMYTVLPMVALLASKGIDITKLQEDKAVKRIKATLGTVKPVAGKTLPEDTSNTIKSEKRVNLAAFSLSNLQ